MTATRYQNHHLVARRPVCGGVGVQNESGGPIRGFILVQAATTVNQAVGRIEAMEPCGTTFNMGA